MMDVRGLSFLILLFPVIQCQPPMAVDTEYGQVIGHVVENVNNGEFSADVRSFLAVPFGKSTAGDLRFRQPEKPDPWSAAFTADTLGQSCPQPEGGLMGMTHPNWTNYGEDCLNMNIFTPMTLDGPHPVMVWFHGGGYNTGANIQYPGHFMATRGVIVAVINYRVNYFGFSTTESAACPGNMGLWDQNLALQFVRDNIANFGGNPDLVTIFGQSAGASSTSLHMVSPQSVGLANQAIIESGTEESFWTLNYPESNPAGYTRQVAAKLNCSEGLTDEQMMDCLRLVDWRLFNLVSFDCTPGHFCQGMAPVLDGDGGFIPKLPEELRDEGQIMNIPIITGITEDDGSFYTLSLVPESIFGGFNESEFEFYMRDRFWSFWEASMNDTTAEDMFQAWMFNYKPWPYVAEEYLNRNAINRFLTDVAFGYAWDRQLKNHNVNNPSTFGYVYGYRGRNATQVFPEWMGVPHMGEIPQVWGYTLLPLNDNVRDDSGIYHDIVDWTDEDRTQTVYWQTLYANFAKYGNPTPEPVQDPLGGMTDWRPFSEDDMAYLYVYNETVEVRTEYRQQDYAFWTEYVSWIIRDYSLPILNEESSQMRNNDIKTKTRPSTWFVDAIADYFDLLSS